MDSQLEAWEEDNDQGDNGESADGSDQDEDEHQPPGHAVALSADLLTAVAQGAGPVRRSSRRITRPVDMYHC